jgi:hypothetical protein
MGERRRLREQDRRSAAIAELHTIDGLLADAQAVLARHWVQGHWFAGEGACLVGAVVQAAGGPATSASQLVHRTLGLTWHALYRRTDERIEWCPPPVIRLGRIRDLAAWNDRPGRSGPEVVELLQRARELAGRELAAAQAPAPARRLRHQVPARLASTTSPIAAATPCQGSGNTDRPSTPIPA